MTVAAGQGLLQQADAVIAAVRAKLTLIASAGPPTGAFDDVIGTLSGGAGGWDVGLRAAAILGVIVCALVVEWPLRSRLRRVHRKLDADDGSSRPWSLLDLAVFGLVDLLAIGAFLPIAAAVYGAFIDDQPTSRLFMIAACLAIGIARTCRIAVSWAFASWRNQAAAAIRPWVAAMTLTAAYGWLATTFLETSGLREGWHLGLCLFASALFVAEMLAMVWSTKELVGGRLRRHGDRTALVLTENWVGAATSAILLIWLAWCLCFLTIGERSLAAIATLAGLAVIAVGGWRDWRGGVALALCAPVLALMWARDAEDLLLTPAAGGLIATVVGGALTLHAIRTAFDRMTPVRVVGEASQPAGRLETLLPLLRITLLSGTTLALLMAALTTLGVDTAPLLAGAGVIGLAIGFGAQTLVRDIITGVFFLVEDAFRIGEYVDVGNNKRGEVEAISPRSIRLRHHRGAIHRVPFSEVRTLTNHSRDWIIDKIVLQVAYDTDIEQLRKLVKGIGQDLMDDPEFGPLMLAPLKSQGIAEFGESGVLVRLKFTSLPAEQFIVRREVMKRLHEGLRRAGVAFAHPRRSVTINRQPPTEDRMATPSGSA